VDFTNYNVPNRLSIIDKEEPKQSIIDSYTDKLQKQLNDTTLDKRFVRKALANLSEADINNIADYAVRKGNNPGRLFVSICHKIMQRVEN